MSISPTHSVSTESAINALKLIKDLQQFVLDRNEVIEKLQKQIESLTEERDNLKTRINNLEEENALLKGTPVLEQADDMPNGLSTCSMTKNDKMYVIDVESSLKKTKSLSVDDDIILTKYENSNFKSRETETHGESTSYEPVTIKRYNSTPASATPEKLLAAKQKAKSVQRSLSRRQRRSDSSNVYELSADLKAMALECLENKYGGKEISNKAARTIQFYYRHHILSKSFKRVRALSGRRRSLTMPEKHFEKLKQASFVFYGPNNPLMIVDDSVINVKTTGELTPLQQQQSPELRKDFEQETNSLLASAVKEYPGNHDSLSTDSDISEENLPLIDNDEMIDEVDHGVNENLDEKAELTESEESEEKKEEVSRSSSSSSQYEIIDDHQVLTVRSRHVDLEDGTSFAVDKIHDHDSTDGAAFSSPFIGSNEEDDDSEVDQAMQKRQYRMGINLFNWKPEVGIGYLIDNGLLNNDVTSIANFFRRETSISKQKISEYFGSLRNEFNMKVLLEFAKSFDYVGKDVDEALRQFQSYFKLTGEAQTVEKFLQVFADRYVECNPGKVSDNPDTILLLAFALAMLNTDLHNQNVKQRMTEQDFMKNLRGCNDGKDLDQTMLKNMYNRIQKNEFATGADHTTQVHQIENSFIGKVPNLSASHRRFVKLFTIEEVYEPNRKEKQHNRLAFLFNDLLILAKPRGKTGGTGHMFSCKSSYTLLNKKVAEFSNDFYKFGILILGKMDHKVIASFNAKDEKTRRSFVSELDEYIRETTGMENIRLALTKNKASQRRKDERTRSMLVTTNSDATAKTTSEPVVAKPEATSLLDLREAGTNEAEINKENKKSKMAMSASMGDITEKETEEYDDTSERMIRTGSSASLDHAYLSSHNSNNDLRHQAVLQTSATLPRASSIRKSLFGLMGPRLRKTSNLAQQNIAAPKTSLDHSRKRTTSQDTKSSPIPERNSPMLKRKSPIMERKSPNPDRRSVGALF